MLSLPSTLSTDKTDIFFGGALRTSYTKLWNLNKFDLTSAPTFGTELSHSPQFSLTLQYEGTSRESLSKSLEKRAFLCYLLLTQIPDEGLNELLETMGEITEFYSARANYRPTPSTGSQPKEMKLQGTYVRPIFTLDDDEEE